MSKTDIEWCTDVWNPLRGCTRVSRGCERCYAEKIAYRFRGPGLAFEGLTTVKGRWNGTIKLVPEKLSEPLRWRKPRRVFVNSMSDLFHEGVPDEYIAAVFGVMAASPQHTFQVLTKRPERAAKWFHWLDHGPDSNGDRRCWYPFGVEAAKYGIGVTDGMMRAIGSHPLHPNRRADAWPLPNVWLGVSVEDQATADERIPLLLQCPAAVRFVSYEPALGPVDFSAWISGNEQCGNCGTLWDPPNPPELEPCRGCGLLARDVACSCHGPNQSVEPPLSWLIVGGESGPGARPFDLAWARSTVRQTRAAGVACFVKQLGAMPYMMEPAWENGFVGDDVRARWPCEDPKGGNMSEWPEDLRVRQFPEVRP